MTDDVDLLLNATPRAVGRTVPGAPPSVDRWRRFRAPPHLRARPCVACLPRLTGCGRSVWPIAIASPTVLTVMSASTRIRSRGHSPRTISYVRTHVVLHPTPGGRGSPPLRWASASHPPCTNPSVTAQSAVTAPLSGEPRAWEEVVTLAHLLATMPIPTSRTRRRGRRPRRPAVAGLPGWVGCGR